MCDNENEMLTELVVQIMNMTLIKASYPSHFEHTLLDRNKNSNNNNNNNKKHVYLVID